MATPGGDAPAPYEVLLGLGANLGDPGRQLAAAVALLAERIDLTAVSSLYRSEPVGYRDQPEFLNLVCAGRTALGPRELLGVLHGVEDALGRARTFRDAPRTIDVDLLDHAGALLETEELTLPHPRLHERAFVLRPLAEAAPGWRHPVLGATAAELLARGERWDRVERIGSLPGQPGSTPPRAERP